MRPDADTMPAADLILSLDRAGVENLTDFAVCVSNWSSVRNRVGPEMSAMAM